MVSRWAVYLTAAFLAASTAALLYVKFFTPPLTAVQLQRRVQSLREPAGARTRSEFVTLGRISVHLRHAVIVAEDSRFYQHRGVDWEGLKQAAQDNWQRGHLWRGGSTITQQLVKNLFLTTYGSVLRKLVEVPLAMLAELILSKERILELYLNVVEWGTAVYGAEAASQHYYGVPAARLTRAQAARLAAVLPAPRARTPQHMRESAHAILRRMASVGW